MKALLLTHDFPPGLSGGIAVYYHQLCRRLGEEIAVLAPAAEGADAFDAAQPFRVHRRPIPTVPADLTGAGGLGPLRWPRTLWLALRQWLRYDRYGPELARAESADLALFGHAYLAPLGPRLARRAGLRWGVVLHGSELHRYRGLTPLQSALVAALEAADVLVVNSEFTRRQYLERGVRPDRTFLKVSPGVDTSVFRPDADDPERVRRAHGLGDRPVVLSVGRLVEWKGADVLLDALPRVADRVSDVAGLIVGDGPHRAALEVRARRLGLADRVVFTGHVPGPELPDYYRAADVLAVPSREAAPGMPIEGFGIVYLEANACGVPAVGGWLGGTEESIVDGVTGFRIDPTDPEMLAGALVRLLTDPELARRMGAAGRERAVARFDWSVQAERLRDGLTGLLEGRAAGPVGSAAGAASGG